MPEKIRWSAVFNVNAYPGTFVIQVAIPEYESKEPLTKISKELEELGFKKNYKCHLHESDDVIFIRYEVDDKDGIEALEKSMCEFIHAMRLLQAPQ